MLFFLFLSFPHTKVRKKNKVLLFHSFYFHFSLLGGGRGRWSTSFEGECHKTWVSHLACVCRSSFLSLTPVYFPGQETAGLAEPRQEWPVGHGRAAMAGQQGCAGGHLRVSGGSRRSCESQRDSPASHGRLQPTLLAGLFSALSTAPSQEQKVNPFFISLKRALWWAGPRLPSLFDPSLLSRPFASGRWHSLIPQVPWGALSPKKGHSQVTAPPLGPVLRAEQLVRACPALTMCLPGQSFVFHPTAALREGFGECLFLQKAQ